jgi:signal peptidase II
VLNKYAIFFLTAISVVLLDQVTKACIVSAMLLHDSFAIIKGFLNITYVRNPGAAFGFLANASPLFRTIFFIAVSFFAVGLIFYYIVKSKEGPGFIFALSLILGGALGNLIDRLRFGEVIDFIDVYVSSYHWPAFNAADSAISIGAAIIIFEVLKREKHNKT